MTALPATVIPGRNPMMTGFSTQIQTLGTHQADTFSSFLSMITAEARWVVQNVEIVGDWETWARARDHCLQGVSDGSFKDQFGTAAFILVSPDEPSLYIKGAVITPGHPDDQNAFRSELAGIYAITVLQWALQQYYHLESGHIEVACDGKSALQQAQWSEDFINTRYPHYDLILAIRVIRNLSKWEWKWRHVKGHQDSTGGELDFWAQLNVQMDSAAKQHWLDNNGSEAPRRIWGEPWQVWAGSKKITSDLSRHLKEFCSAQTAENYWRGKPRISDKFEQVDWEAIGGAMQQIPLSRRIWISKQVTGFCATGNTMFRRKARSTAQCPRCTEDETPAHVLRCRGSDASTIWDRAITKLKNWLQDNLTHPEMSNAIINYLAGWRDDAPVGTRISQEWIRRAFSGQSLLGWRNCLEGILHVSWRQTQQEYFARIGSARSPKRWTVALIQKLWDIAWDMWEHRNGILHDKDQSIILTALNNDIRDEFKRGYDGLSKETQALFSPGSVAILQKPAEVKQQWLARVQLARQRSFMGNVRGLTYRQERQTMSRWLQGS
jgi:hypothetical protein